MQTQAIKNIAEKFNFVTVYTVGKSLCGRNITALMTGNCKNPVLYVATFHGMEWINTLILLEFFEELCIAQKYRRKIFDTDIYAVLNRRGLVLIPCVNPDGVEIQINGAKSCPRYERLINSITEHTEHWQANARGVDLNHNFDAGWQQLKREELRLSITAASASRFGGRCPFSEPETAALKDLCIKERFSHVIAFHSQGREVYSTFKNTPQKSIDLGNLFAENSGYKVSEPDKIATGGGFKDWVIEHLKTPAITVETGFGKNPLPISDYPGEYRRIKRALVFCLAF